MNPSADALLALLLIERRLASREDIKRLWAKKQSQRAARGIDPPLGQLVTQEKVLSPRDYLQAQNLVRKMQRSCSGCRRPFAALPRAGSRRRRCLACGVTTALPDLRSDLDDFGSSAVTRRRGPVDTASLRNTLRKQRSGRIDPEGRRLPERIGPYEILGFIATGGMGVIYRARRDPDSPEVALKVLREGASDDIHERFRREGEAEARLDHPALVKVFDRGDDEGLAWFTMELVDGEPLDAIMAEGRPISLLVRLLAQVARGLDHAHENGIIHRDMKPQNILVTRDGKAKLADFGLARDLGLHSLSRSGDLIGTPLYMAPEQVNPRMGKVDRRTDVFALGVILFQMLTGRLPFPARSLVELQNLLLRKPAPRPTKVAENVPLALEEVCLNALEKKPEHRYATARDFAEALETWLEGGALTSGSRSFTSLSFSGVFDGSLTRGPAVALAGLGGALGILLLLTLLAFAWSGGDAEAGTRAAAFAGAQTQAREALEGALERARKRLPASASSVSPLEAAEAYPEALEALAEADAQLALIEGPLGELAGEARALNTRARLGFAALLLKHDDQRLGEAEQLLAPLLERAEPPPQALILRARLALARGEPQLARALAHEVVAAWQLTRKRPSRDRPANSPSQRDGLEAWRLRGQAHIACGEADLAVMDISSLISELRSDPDLDLNEVFDAHFDLSQAQLAAGRRKDSAETLQRLLAEARDSSWPGVTKAREALAELQLESGRWRQAEELTEDLPPEEEAISLRGRLATVRGETEAAVARFEDIVSRSPSAETLRHAAEAWIQLASEPGQDPFLALRSAASLLDRALQERPDVPAALLARARVAFLLGDATEARRALERLDGLTLRADERHSQRLLRIHLARVQSNLKGAVDLARDELEAASKSADDNGRLASLSLTIELWELYEFQQLQKTDSAIPPSPPSSPAREWSARWHRARARRHVSDAVQSRESGNEGDAAGHDSAAERAFRRALEINPLDPIARRRQSGSWSPSQAEVWPLPELEGFDPDSWDPVLEVIALLRIAKACKAAGDNDRAYRLHKWGTSLLPPDDFLILDRP